MQVSIELNLYYFFVVAVKGVSNALYNGIWLSGNVEEFRDTFNILLVGLEGSIKLGILEILPTKEKQKARRSPGRSSEDTTALSILSLNKLFLPYFLC